MTLKLNPVWQIDGVSLPRNPDSFSLKWDKANVSYEKQASGLQRRVQAPRLTTAADYVLTWKNATRRVVRSVLQYCNQTYPLPGASHAITIDQVQPPLIIQGWFDTPEIQMSKDIYTTKPGEGGHLQDLTITIRTDGRGCKSLNTIPYLGTITQAGIQASFGGAIGNYLDNLPTWNGQPWVHSVASSTVFAISNLGNQEWLPTIKMNGPFTGLTLIQLVDIDGSGQGLQWTWTGSSLAPGAAVLFDTEQLRCYTVIAGIRTEVYTFKVEAVYQSIPFGYWPGLPPGNTTFSSSAYLIGSTTSFDFTNNGNERFPYWI